MAALPPSKVVVELAHLGRLVVALTGYQSALALCQARIDQRSRVGYLRVVFPGKILRGSGARGIFR